MMGPNAQATNVDQRNFLSILNQPEFSDITLMVEGKPIYCH